MTTKTIPIPKGVTVLGTSNGIQHLSNGTYRSVSSGKAVQANSLGEARKTLGNTGTGVSNNTPASPSGPAGPVASNNPLNTAPELINTQLDVNKASGAQGNLIQNGNQEGPGSTITNDVDPNTGQLITKKVLSAPNQQILGGLQGNATTANSANGGLIQSAFGSLSGDPSTYKMSPYEQAIYGKLTQNISKQQQQETDQLKQDLQNRGIPIGSDEYNKELGNVSDKYQSYFQQANDSAISQGANLTNQAITTLGQQGQQGFYDPTMQTNAVSYGAGAPNVGTAVNTLGQLDIGKINAGANVTSANASATNAGATVTNSQTQQALATLAAQQAANNPNTPKPGPYQTTTGPNPTTTGSTITG